MFLVNVWHLRLGRYSTADFFPLLHIPNTVSELGQRLYGLMVKSVKGRRRPHQLALTKDGNVWSLFWVVSIWLECSAHAHTHSCGQRMLQAWSQRVCMCSCFSLFHYVRARGCALTPLQRASNPSPIVARREPWISDAGVARLRATPRSRSFRKWKRRRAVCSAARASSRFWSFPSAKALRRAVVRAPQVRWSIPYCTHSWLTSRPVWAYNPSYIWEGHINRISVVQTIRGIK